MERRLFGGAATLENCEDKEEEEGGIDLVDEGAERRGVMPKRGDGGWVVI